MGVLPIIRTFVGDTQPKSITFTRGGVALAGPTSAVLTVSQQENPTDQVLQVDQATGADLGSGVWEFTFGDPSSWPRGTHWYDVEFTYPGGETETVGKNRFKIDGPITQGAVTAFQILTASIDQPGPIELGDDVTTPQFLFSYSAPPSSAVLDSGGEEAAEDIIASPTNHTSIHTFSKTGINDTIPFTLTADDGGTPDTDQLVVQWRPAVYTGVIAFQSSYTEGEIEALVKRLRTSSALGVTSLSPVGGQAIVHAYPAAYGPRVPADFQIGDIGPGDMAEIQTALSVTNAFGVVLPYRVARSDFGLNFPGGINFQVFS